MFEEEANGQLASGPPKNALSTAAYNGYDQTDVDWESYNLGWQDEDG